MHPVHGRWDLTEARREMKLPAVQDVGDLVGIRDWMFDASHWWALPEKGLRGPQGKKKAANTSLSVAIAIAQGNRKRTWGSGRGSDSLEVLNETRTWNGIEGSEGCSLRAPPSPSGPAPGGTGPGGRCRGEGVAGDPQGRISWVSVTLVTPDPAGDIQNRFQRWLQTSLKALRAEPGSAPSRGPHSSPAPL